MISSDFVGRAMQPGLSVGTLLATVSGAQGRHRSPFGHGPAVPVRWSQGVLGFLARLASRRAIERHRDRPYVAREPLRECPRDRALLYLYPGICD